MLHCVVFLRNLLCRQEVAGIIAKLHHRVLPAETVDRPVIETLLQFDQPMERTGQRIEDQQRHRLRPVRRRSGRNRHFDGGGEPVQCRGFRFEGAVDHRTELAALLFERSFDGGAGQDVVKGVEEEHFPQRFQIRGGGMCRGRDCFDGSFGPQQCRFRLSVEPFEAGNGRVAAAQTVVEFALELRQFPSGSDLLFQRGEEAAEGGESHLELRMRRRPGEGAFDLSARGAAAVVAEAESDADVSTVPLCLICRQPVQAGGDIAFGGVGEQPIGEEGSASGAAPAEEVAGQFELLGAHEGEVLETVCGEKVGNACAVPETVGSPGGDGRAAEFFAEVLLPLPVVSEERFRRRHIVVGLDPVAADALPAAGIDQIQDVFPQFRIERFDVVINGSFAAVEHHFGELFKQSDQRPAGADSFIQPFAAVPEPDRIEVRVRQQVDDLLHGAVSPRLAASASIPMELTIQSGRMFRNPWWLPGVIGLVAVSRRRLLRSVTCSAE